MKNIIYIILLFSSAAFGQVDELKAELKLVKEANSQANGVSMKVGYFMYKDYTSSDIYEQHAGHYSKKGNLFKNFIYGSLTIQTEKYLMVKDDSAKVIMLAKPSAKTNMNIEVEEVLQFCSEVKALKAKKNGQKAFQLLFKQGKEFEYAKIDIYINSTTHLLEEMVLYYGRPVDYSKDPRNPDLHYSKMRITYTNNTSKKLSNSDFSINKYIVVKGSKPALTEKYKSYELILSPELNPAQ